MFQKHVKQHWKNTKSSMTFNNTYNNFDTDANIMYEYTPDDPSQVAAIVEEGCLQAHGHDKTQTRHAGGERGVHAATFV